MRIITKTAVGYFNCERGGKSISAGQMDHSTVRMEGVSPSAGQSNVNSARCASVIPGIEICPRGPIKSL